jgi:molybdopterin-binding protein
MADDRLLTLGEAAKLLGVSADTLRRWDRAGKLRTERDERNRRLVSTAELRRLGAGPDRHRVGDRVSARNRFPGTVESIEVDGVLGIVEIQAGPHRISAVITRDAIEELALVEGDRATAMIKATSVMVIKEDEDRQT